MEKIGKEEQFVRADISKFSDASHITKGVDAVIHLGGYSVEGPWDAILNANIVGCHNIFEAARQNGVKRILFPSSNHAVGFYRRKKTIDDRVYPKPDGRYGVSKVFGEALGSLYADKYGMQVYCIRWGNVNPLPIDKRRLSIWLSPRDLAQLVTIGIEHPKIKFEIVYGVSRNKRSWYDNSNAYRLGYKPQDNAEKYAKEVLKREKPGDPVSEKYQGGIFYRSRRGQRTQHRCRRRRKSDERPQAQSGSARWRNRHSHAHLQHGGCLRPQAAHHCLEISLKTNIARCRRQLGLSRVIVVQPNAYEDDNRVTLAAIANWDRAQRGSASSSQA